jgi:hypothetical protein
MGRTRTPTAVLELRGAFRRNPNRRRKFEPLVTTALPEPRPGLRRCSRLRTGFRGLVSINTLLPVRSGD